MKRLLVFALAAILVGALTAPAIAEVKVGASARFLTNWINESEELSATGDARTDHMITETGISRVNFSFTGEDTTAFAEFNMAVGLRHLFGTWAFAEGSELLVGHTWSPVLEAGSSQVMLYENGFGYGFGDFYGGRAPQVRYTRTLDFGAVKIAALMPAKTAPAVLTGTAHALFPKIEGAVDFKVADLTISPAFSFNTFEVEGPDETVQSWVVGADLNWPLAMAKIVAHAYYGQNLYIYGSPGANEIRGGAVATEDYEPVGAANEIEENTTGYGGFLEVQFPFEPVTLAAGYGMAVASNDKAEDYVLGATEDAVSRYSFFVNVKYVFNENFYIQPEVSYFNYGDDWAGEERGTEMWYGALWRFDF